MEVKELIERVDILEYISHYTDFERRGNEYFALSPLKEEKTPSFSVDPEKQIFYDFSSGIGGDVLTFVREYHKCSFYEAVNILKKYSGCEGDVNAGDQRLSTTAVIKKVAASKRPAKISTAKILPNDYMERYDWDIKKLQVWIDEGIPSEILYEHGVRYDPFASRIVYPIHDLKGRIINVSGRTIDPRWKEKKLRKYTYYFDFSAWGDLYDLFRHQDAILQEKSVVIFEGAKSCMKAEHYGTMNTVALLTSHLNEAQLKILIQMQCHCIFALDSDVDLRKDKNVQKLMKFCRVSWVKNRDNLLDEKESPVDRGPEVWANLYERMVRLN